MINPFQSDIENLKKMTFKKKVEFILGYYNMQILIAAICIFLFGGLAYYMFTRNSGNGAVTLCIFDGFCEDIDTTSQTLNQSFNRYIGAAEDAKDSVILDESFLGMGSITDRQEQAITLQRLEELGVLITCTVPAEISSSMQEYSYVCGIDLSSIPDNALAQAGYYLTEDASIGIAANARDMDLTLKLLDLIIEPLIES